MSSSADKNLLNKADDTLVKRSLTARRRIQSGRKATEVMLELLQSALKSGFSASYVLFDTWFSSPSSLIAVKKIGIDVNAMTKKTPKIHYLIDGEKKSVKATYSFCKKRRGRSRYLLSSGCYYSKRRHHVTGQTCLCQKPE